MSFFDSYVAGERQRRAFNALQKQSFALCFNDWPEFMSVSMKGRGTPRVEHFDDDAELAAAYVADQIADRGSTAAWWEVKNESNVASEWAHLKNKDIDS